MNKNRRFLLIILLTLLACPLFAENWYVCLSSFTKKSNAEHLIQQMEKNDLHGCIEVSCNKSTIYFRVLLDEPFDTVQEARSRRDQMNSSKFVKAYGLKGLWPCKANPENFVYVCPKGESFSSKPDAAAKADVATAAPVEEEVVVVDEKLVVVEVAEPVAEAVESVAPAEVTATEAPVVTEPAATSAETTEPAEETVAAEVSATEAPATTEEAAPSAEANAPEEPKLKPEVSDIIQEINLRCMKMVPQVEGHYLSLFYLFDFDNIRESGVNIPQLAKLDQYVDDASYIHSAALARYVNEQSGRYVEFYAAVGSKNSFGYLELSGAVVRYSVEGEDLDSFIYTDGESYFFVGTDKYREIMIRMSAPGYSREEIKEFLKQIVKNSTVEEYEEVPAHFNLLPKTNENVQRSFQSFCLEKIGDEYINARDGKDWAQALRGCYNSKSVIISDNRDITLSLFNLQSPDAAITEQNYYVEEQKLNEVGDNNRATRGWNGTAWFKSNFEEDGKPGKELTFAKNEFWVAAKGYNSITEDELQDFCFDLQLY